MRRLPALLAAVSLSAAGLVAFAGGVPAQPDPVGRLFGLTHRPVCPGEAGPGAARCNADVVLDASGKPLATTSYQNGYAPADLASAYGSGTPASGAWVWNKQTVAIVDAHSNPNDVSDLATYRSTMGLPPCTVASGCFTEVNGTGGSSLPAGDTSWGQEISLDLDMVSAVCPMCKILMVDGSSTSLADLGTGVNTAASLGANAVSNSYGTSGEFSSEASYGDTYYNNHPGIAITASSGDSGYGVEFPAVSRNVVAVGGTSLVQAGNARGWSETVWSGAGSGCSTYIPQQSWQASILASSGRSGCSRRVVGDVAAVADPNTGVAVYDSYGSSSGANWYVFGGTSVASPIIASTFARANAASGKAITNGMVYGATSGSLNDVTSGSNGRCTSRRSTATAWLCTGEPGYDGPTGMGTPQGLVAF